MPRSGHSLPELVFSGALDRHAERRTESGLLERLLADETTAVLELRGGLAPIAERVDDPAPLGPRLVLRPPRYGDGERLVAYLGESGGTAYVLVAGPGDDRAPEGWRGLRSVGVQLGDVDALLFATGLALWNWHSTHGHCPRCGAPTEVVQAGWVRRCRADDSLHFPRTDPAVIMSVVDDDDRLLLARGAGFTSVGMSVLAGFVEPGESLAAAVAREVLEEVGLVVHDVTYLGDQPWPFPASLMIGFTARADLGPMALQAEEIDSARWFTREELVSAVRAGEVVIPQRLSIARRLIEHWFGGPIDAPEVAIRRS
ncbi:NADH pyrophosphatase [Nostocoides japonicum T1-X7]|uniref:NAD(+) diphosphatase n=1 Tax=Nostocoides japonicum T1-X7 TaxID=1194083 RepID=A0A077LZI2_9MICO|nr:NAD(+) diphosphatase [Tetrasphaera japonica]CCH77390.1 NADH pyrophosphatase [Tetrasphaera japonica T1-X7]